MIKPEDIIIIPPPHAIQEAFKDLERALELAWDLECGISWYDVEDTKKELNTLRYKYKVDPYDVEEEDAQ